MAEAVCAELEARGIECWIAPRNIVSGTKYSHSIIKSEAGRIEIELAMQTELAEEIYGDLWMCEHVLESERREWLRLMIEAEWFA